MARQELDVAPPDFAGRLELAMKDSGKTQSRTERESGLQGKGRIFRLLGKGKNPIASPGPEVIRLLADYLGVAYEWLAIGRGPMHPDGWAPSELEEAMLFARRHGAREDAIAAAAARFRDASDMTAIDWVKAFDEEARRLDRMGTARPEAVAKGQAKVRRATTKRAKAAEERRRPTAPPPRRKESA